MAALVVAVTFLGSVVSALALEKFALRAVCRLLRPTETSVTKNA